MSGRFVSIDFETANASLASICQVGIVEFMDGRVVGEWKTLIDPEEWFDGINISVHGIDEDMVRGAPKLPDVFLVLEQRMRDQIVVCHTHFDRIAFAQASTKSRLTPFACRWLDSAKLVRRCWDQFGRAGYGLSNVCEFLGIQYRAHDALEDARAAGLVMLHAMAHTGMDLEACIARVRQPVSSAPIAQQGDPTGYLFGEEIVFTGALTMLRAEAAACAARVGCSVANTIRKTTTMLVVGDQDVTRCAGHTKSTKHRKAEEANKKGQSIRILRDSDFLSLVTAYATQEAA